MIDAITIDAGAPTGARPVAGRTSDGYWLFQAYGRVACAVQARVADTPDAFLALPQFAAIDNASGWSDAQAVLLPDGYELRLDVTAVPAPGSSPARVVLQKLVAARP